MKTAEEIQQSARELLDDDERDVLVKMNKIIKALQERDMSDWQQPVISDAIMDLSSLMINLGQTKSKLRLQVENAESIKKEKIRARFLKEKDDGRTDATSKMISEQSAIADEVNERMWRYLYDWVQNFYNDIERYISVSQSWLKVNRSDEVRSNI